MRLIDVCLDGGQRLGLAGIEADGRTLLLPRDRRKLRHLMKDAIGADPKTKLSPWTIGEVRDAWAEYDRLGRTHEGYADTAAAHLAHTILEALW